MPTQESNMMVISCSGASNTGCYADNVARRLSERGEADMVCLPKIAINDENLIEKLKNTSKKVVVIDGCPINCAERILNEKGIEDFAHINITEFGVTKGKTPLTDDKIEEIIDSIKEMTVPKTPVES